VSADIKTVTDRYPVRVPSFYAGLIERHNPACPIGRQALPALEELDDTEAADPLAEEAIAATPTLLKRYPGRALFLVSSACAMYCRFCNRKRLVGTDFDPELSWEETLRYLEGDRTTSEVILSGGDPLVLSAGKLSYLLERLRGIGHIKILRISTRIPVVHPEGLTDDHVRVLQEAAPLWVIVHVNHPREVTPQFIEMTGRIRRAGNMLVGHTVLLRGVNDCPHILLRLFTDLVRNSIKPYHLFQMDEVRGTGHFKVRIDRGLEIMRFLRMNASGLAIPQYTIDITGGLGKVPAESHCGDRYGDMVVVRGLDGRSGLYHDNGQASECLNCTVCLKT
jgi:lysine 2,3-aminomutase